jgi:hypothetical protein
MFVSSTNHAFGYTQSITAAQHVQIAAVSSPSIATPKKNGKKQVRYVVIAYKPNLKHHTSTMRVGSKEKLKPSTGE